MGRKKEKIGFFGWGIDQKKNLRRRGKEKGSQKQKNPNGGFNLGVKGGGVIKTFRRVGGIGKTQGRRRTKRD